MFFIFRFALEKSIGIIIFIIIVFLVFGFQSTTQQHWFTSVANLYFSFATESMAKDVLLHQCIHSFVFINFAFVFVLHTICTSAWQFNRRNSEEIAIRYVYIYYCSDNIVRVNNFEIIGSSSMHFTDNTSFHQTAHTHTRAHLIYQFDHCIHMVHSYFEIQIVQRFEMRSCLFHHMHEFMLHCSLCSS